MNDLLLSKRLDGKVVGKAEIFAMLRKIAVIQESMNNLNLEMIKVGEKIIENTSLKEENLALRKQILLKEKKLKYFFNKLRRNAVKYDDLKEDNELEEILYGKQN